MVYTVKCEVAHPPEMPRAKMSWWDKQHKMDADDLSLICRGMKIQGWRCEVICNCHTATEETLLKHLLEVLGTGEDNS